MTFVTKLRPSPKSEIIHLCWLAELATRNGGVRWLGRVRKVWTKFRSATAADPLIQGALDTGVGGSVRIDRFVAGYNMLLEINLTGRVIDNIHMQLLIPITRLGAFTKNGKQS